MRELTTEEKELIVTDPEKWNKLREEQKHEYVSFSNGPEEFNSLFEHKTLEDIDLSHIKFNDMGFWNLQIGKNVNLAMTIFNWCSFKGLFENCEIKRCSFHNCLLNEMWNTKVYNTNFIKCEMSNSIIDSYFEDIKVIDCHFRKINIRYSTIFSSSINDSCLDRMELRNVKIKNCHIFNTDINRAKFTLSKFENNYIDNCSADTYFPRRFNIFKDNMIENSTIE